MYAPQTTDLDFIGNQEVDSEALTSEFLSQCSTLNDAELAEFISDRTPTNTKAATIFEFLVEVGSLVKLTKYVVHRAGVPSHLWEDAEQEVQMTWASMPMKPGMAPRQIRRGAGVAGERAAWAVRRRIGAVVKIARFGKGQNNKSAEAFMKGIGAAVNPKNIEDLSDSLELSVEPEDLERAARESEVLRRLAPLRLSPDRMEIVRRACCDLEQPSAIAKALKLTKKFVEAVITEATEALYSLDSRKATEARYSLGSRKAA